MDKKFFDTLRSKKYSAFWHCCNCTGDSNTQPISITPNLSDLISEMRDKLKGELYSEIKKEIDELSGLIQQKFDKLLVIEKSSDTNSHLDTDKNAQQPVTHTILINSENEGETCFSKDSWTEVVKNNIQPQLKSIPVSKAVRSKEGKGVLFFPTKELRNEAALKLKDTFKLEKQDRKLKFLSPKLKISWIPKQYFDEIDKKSLKQSILTKNSNISRLVSDEKKKFDIIFINDEKDENYSYAVIKVDPEIKEAIVSQGNKLFIGLSSCKVTDRYHILQCYKCQEFGHKVGSSKCTLEGSEKEICLYCAGDHKSKSCEVEKNDSNNFKCHNCSMSKDDKIKSNCIGHTTNSFKCPIFQTAIKNTINRTMSASYSTNFSKNAIST